MKRAPLLLIPLALALGLPAWADPPCGVVEVRFKPAAPNMQIVVWIEDPQGKVIDTPYITRLTGQFGLGNRPGAALLKTDFRWPYGRREMVLPIWAHRRDKRYPKVMMGGICGNSPSSRCPDGSLCGGECEDSTIAYHSRVSSYEPFYCSPSGPSRVDIASCASKGTFSKGAYATNGEYSLYPPRADITTMNPSVDSKDLLDFAAKNDLVAVSAATPPAGALVAPAIYWYPQNLVPGDYVAHIEVSKESDFNAAHNHPNQADSVAAWDFEGHPFLGQPSVVYSVPFRYDPQGSSAITPQYAGYSTWDGSDGVLHPPDATITTNTPGSGAGRLADVNDGLDVYRAKVVVGSCASGDGGPVSDGGITPVCLAPDPVTELALTPTQTSIQVSFKAPAGGAQPNRFAIRYREGSTPIDEASFDAAVAAPSMAATTPGAPISVEVPGLMRSTRYAVAVRGIAPCGRSSSVVSETTTTADAKFAVLHGCFIATAAFGSPMERQVTALRRFRDQHLLVSPAGRLATAAYYALSPPLARAISTSEPLRALARIALSPIVELVTR